jgi:thiosulfate/3-mercaptopyruvate sulfurtransferase
LFDFEAFSCQKANFDYAVPSEAQFKDQMKEVNVRKSDLIVVYDKIGKVSAPRAYWMLKTFGIENVAILNCSFNKWVAENRPIEDGDIEKAWKRIRTTKAEP